MCINQFFKDKNGYYKEVVDNYLLYIHRHEFRFNNKRRLWHIKNNKKLFDWVTRMGVDTCP